MATLTWDLEQPIQPFTCELADIQNCTITANGIVSCDVGHEDTTIICYTPRQTPAPDADTLIPADINADGYAFVGPTEFTIDSATATNGDVIHVFDVVPVSIDISQIIVFLTSVTIEANDQTALIMETGSDVTETVLSINDVSQLIPGKTIYRIGTVSFSFLTTGPEFFYRIAINVI